MYFQIRAYPSDPFNPWPFFRGSRITSRCVRHAPLGDVHGILVNVSVTQEVNVTRTTMTVVIAAAVVALTACGSEPANRNANVNSNRAATSNAANANRGAGEMTREAFEREKDRIAKEAKDLGRKIGNGADDLWIWTRTRAAIASENDLRDSTIDIDVDQNVVTLTGRVPTVLQKARAESIARGIAGVKTVTNLLNVGTSTSPSNENNRPR